MRRVWAVALCVAGAGSGVGADPAALAAAVDRHVAAGWARAGVRPADPADDATFLRRVSLDLTGRIPAAPDVRAFLADPDPGKRTKAIDRLAAHPLAAAHLARVWRARWLPQTAALFEELKPEFEDRLRGQLAANVPYDRMVRDLLRPPGEAAGAAPGDGRAPALFLQANEFQPANLAGSAARMFLGVNLDCARCHDHPFAKWTRRQFWEFAAFFAPAADGGVPRLDVPTNRDPVEPRFPDGTAPAWPAGAAGRAVLADWRTARGNPYFARNAVNLVWADLFGTGLVEPLDDLSDGNRPSHPELLDDLAAAFAGSGFDLRFLLRALTRTRGYQLSSAGSGPAPPARLFARFAVRAMTGDQLYDSLTLAAGVDQDARARAAFVARFDAGGRPTEAGRTVLQALALANGGLVAAAADPDRGGTLGAAADSPFLTPEGRVEALFLAALSRPPTPAEARRLTAFVGRSADPRRALGSVFWATLNGHEFSTVH